MKKETEKIVVITGGVGGIGRATALKLTALKYYPIILDRDEEAGKKAMAELEAAGFKSEFYVVELTSLREVNKVFGDILAQHEQVEALVNLAADTL